MKFEDVKNEIINLATKHKAVNAKYIKDELFHCEMIEGKVQDLIVKYAEHNGYLINGFPTEKREEEIIDEDEDEEYFSDERFELYLDTLCL